MKTTLLPLLLFSVTANAADLSTTFSSTYSKITVNNTISYTGTVVNKGTDTASNVQLIFYMPPKNVSIGNLPSGCSSTNIKISCSIGGLNVGDSATRTVSVFYTKKGGAAVSVNAITDSNDTNYSNNFTRLTTHVTSSTNTANSPLIPNLASAKASPISVLQGNALTFTANLDAPLPSGYSVKVTIDGSNYTLTGAGTNYSLSNTPNTSGLKTFKTGVYDSYGSLKGSEMTGTFEVTKPNTAPTLSIISGADTATARTAYTLQLQANDADGNLSNIQITNWGDGSSNYQAATNNNTLSFSHTFNSAGSYTISATAYDSANTSSSTISKTVTVSAAAVKADTNPTGTSGYTKIANNGAALPDSATLGGGSNDWACTKDNKTGLIWEVKTNDNYYDLRGQYSRYSWYEPDASKNGGFAGYQNSGSCTTSGNCNTYAFTNAVNAQGLCGANDWRMPTRDELQGLVYCSDGKYNKLDEATLNTIAFGFFCASNANWTLNTTSPTINVTYFPDIQYNFWFWSSSPTAKDSRGAWEVHFDDSFSNGNGKDNSGYVRLVR